MNKLVQKDWPSALFILVIGLGAVLGSKSYTLGTLARMGPGYFPTLLGMLLILMGLLMLVGPRGDEVKTQGTWRGRLRPWGCTILGMLAFVLIGQYGGFAPAIFALILIAAFGDRANSTKTNVMLASAVTIVAVAVFHYGLQLQFPLFVWG